MAKFKLGKLVATAAIVDKMQNDHVFAAFVSKSIRRYQDCDWGDSSETEKEHNYSAIENNYTIRALYEQDGVKGPMKILIITEANRSATTIRFPYEF